MILITFGVVITQNNSEYKGSDLGFEKRIFTSHKRMLEASWSHRCPIWLGTRDEVVTFCESVYEYFLVAFR